MPYRVMSIHHDAPGDPTCVDIFETLESAKYAIKDILDLAKTEFEPDAAIYSDDTRLGVFGWLVWKTGWIALHVFDSPSI